MADSLKDMLNKGKKVFSQTMVYVVLCGICFVNMPVADAETVLPGRSETAGAVLQQQLQGEQQNMPQAEKVDVKVESEYKPAMVNDSGLRVTVKQFRFAGDTVIIGQEELQKLAMPYKNKEIGMAELNSLTAEITKVLRAADYVVAVAYLPQQEIDNGIVTINIIGGRYGNISINNSSKVSEQVLAMELACLKKGEFIRNRDIERAALLLNDLSGVAAKLVLAAGEKIGTSDINVEVKKSSSTVDWQLTYDNFGSYNIGVDEAGLNGYWSNLSGRGDSFSLRANTGALDGLLLGALNWQLPFGADGGKLSLGYSQVTYKLGKNLAASDSSGQADVANISWSRSLKRSRLQNINFSIGFDNAQLSNKMYSLTGRQTVDRMVLGLSGDWMDNSGGNAWSMNWTCGEASMDNQSAQWYSDNIIHNSGMYNKFAYSFMRQQRVADRVSLLLKVNGQWADKNLVSFEDMSLGGPYAVRAYGIGQSSGDAGFVGTAEFRWLLPNTENLQMTAFYDMGEITFNTNPIPGQGANSQSLSGYGLGLIWNRPDLYSVNVSYAWRACSQPSTIGDYPDSNGRLWIMTSISI